MAATASPARDGVRNATSWGVLFASPERAQGEEGRTVGHTLMHAPTEWRGASAYVETLLDGDSRPPTGQTRIFVAALALVLTGAAFLVAGFGTQMGGICFPLGAAFGLAAYVLLARWVAANARKSRLLRFAERVRRALAYEGELDA